MYFNVNFNVFFKLTKVHLLVSGLYIYQNARYKDKKKIWSDMPTTWTSASNPLTEGTCILEPQFQIQ